jgi:hypothetical protein
VRGVPPNPLLTLGYGLLRLVEFGYVVLGALAA